MMFPKTLYTQAVAERIAADNNAYAASQPDDGWTYRSIPFGSWFAVAAYDEIGILVGYL